MPRKAASSKEQHGRVLETQWSGRAEKPRDPHPARQSRAHQHPPFPSPLGSSASLPDRTNANHLAAHFRITFRIPGTSVEEYPGPVSKNNTPAPGGRPRALSAHLDQLHKGLRRQEAASVPPRVKPCSPNGEKSRWHTLARTREA